MKYKIKMPRFFKIHFHIQKNESFYQVLSSGIWTRGIYPHCKKTKVSNKYFFSKYDQIHRKLRTCSYLLKKYLMGNFVFCAVQYTSRFKSTLNPVLLHILRGVFLRILSRILNTFIFQNSMRCLLKEISKKVKITVIQLVIRKNLLEYQ